jgi:mannose-6-phosphate isomerase-like protein (cupin superfamily)
MTDSTATETTRPTGRRLSIGAVAVLVLATGVARGDPPAVFDAVFAGRRVTIERDALIARANLSEGQDFVVVELARDDRTSHHVVAIRDREAPHRHDRHDLFVVILRGHGTMRIGDQERPVGLDSILYVPRGTTQAFRNTSGEPAIAYAVYTPAFDGSDRVPVDSD